MKRLLIDVSDLELWSGSHELWSGNHGGIQRVSYGLSDALWCERGALPVDVGFMAFDPRAGAFAPSDFGALRRRVAADHLRAGGNNKPSVRGGLARRVAKLPAARAMLRPIVGRRAARRSTRTPIEFSKHDVVVVPGVAWANPDVQRTLAGARRQQGLKLCHIVYDLILPLRPHLHDPHLLAGFAAYMVAAAESSDLILSISDCTTRDFVTFCQNKGIEPPPIAAIRLADVVRDDEAPPARKPHPGVADEFILCVGTVEIRKNHALLYAAYRRAAEQGIELPQLVVIGGRGWLSEQTQQLLEQDPLLRDRVLIIDDADDGGLLWAYMPCLFTVYPSMYEGWGLPVAESLSHGKLCAASESSSIPEIAGDLIDYFSPYSADQCLGTMQRYLDPGVRRRKEEAVRARYSRTTWRDTLHDALGHIDALR